MRDRDDRPRSAQRAAQAAGAAAVGVDRNLIAMDADGDRADAMGNGGDALPRIGQDAGEAALGRCGDGAAFHPPPQRPDRAEALDRVGADELGGVVAADVVGEDLDRAAARGDRVGEAGHQDFDAAEVGREALGGEGDQGDSLSC